MKGKEITINLNGITHTITTDNNGQATLPINLLPGKYTAKIQYKQDNTYLSSFADADILINKAATSLTTENISAVYGDSVSLIITLKDNKNNALKGKEITINLNGSIYYPENTQQKYNSEKTTSTQHQPPILT